MSTGCKKHPCLQQRSYGAVCHGPSLECNFGDAENAGKELQDWKMQHQIAMVENAGLENAAQNCKVEIAGLDNATPIALVENAGLE